MCWRCSTFANQDQHGAKCKFELPQVADNVWVRRCYWQLILPASEHVVSEPRDYTAEYVWAWTGAWWGRVPVMDQSDPGEVGGGRCRPVRSGGDKLLSLQQIRAGAKRGIDDRQSNLDRWWCVIACLVCRIGPGLRSWLAAPHSSASF